MILDFTPISDSGSPEFVFNEFWLIQYDQVNTGRYLSPLIEVTPGTSYTVKLEARTSPNGIAEAAITFWKDKKFNYLSSAKVDKLFESNEEFRPAEFSGKVPAEARYMRVELRAWAGSGTNEWREVELELGTEEPPPPPPPPPPAENQYKVHGFISGRYIVLETTNLPTLGPDEIPVEWPKYPVSGIIWQDTISLWIDKAA